MERRNSGCPDREVHVSLETSRVGEQCLNDSYEHPLRANDGETQAPRKFRLEGVGELSRGHAQ